MTRISEEVGPTNKNFNSFKIKAPDYSTRCSAVRRWVSRSREIGLPAGRAANPLKSYWRLQSDILPQHCLQSTHSHILCVAPSQAWISARFHYKCPGGAGSAPVMNRFLLRYRNKQNNNKKTPRGNRGNKEILRRNRVLQRSESNYPCRGQKNKKNKKHLCHIFGDYIEDFETDTPKWFQNNKEKGKIIAVMSQWVSTRQ